MESPVRSTRTRNPRRVRAAREAMFPAEANELLEALGELLCEPTRAKIARALMVSELTVGDLAAVIGRSQSSTSQHLRTMRGLGLVRSRRRGRVVYNSLAPGAITNATSQILGTVAEIAAQVKMGNEDSTP